MHYLLFYELADDYLARRGEFRQQHLDMAWKASDRGELVLAGALADPVDGAVLLSRGDSPEVAEKFARTDPYVTSGLVTRWRVRPWTTVAGEDAASPVRADPAPKGVARIWKAKAATQQAPEYFEHASEKVFPALRRIGGFRGAYLLRRTMGEAVEIMVLTLWESMNAIRTFAGPEPEKAVVDPEARDVLLSCDEHVTHFEVESTCK